MPRNAAMKKALSLFATATEAGFAASEPAMQQLFNAAKGRALSTLSRAAKDATRAGAVAAHSAAQPCCQCGKILCAGHRGLTTGSASLAEAQLAYDAKAPSLVDRHATIAKHFPTSLAADDFMSRVELALAGYGFTGDNTIAMSNLCRDESCLVLEDKIEAVFGSCFSTHGLGGVLTCGVIGMKAGLSHSPVVNGKERYVFFSFPHIAIDSEGKVGAISRPNRPGASAACGALIACMGDLKRDGLEKSTRQPGVHDPLEPEYSILKQRIARRMAHEKVDPAACDLVEITKAAERTITADLEYLISKAVDPSKADYAVFSGVQIHNWANNLNNPEVPSMEFVGVGKSYVVVNGEKVHLDLSRVPALSPRQLQILSQASLDDSGKTAAATSGTSSLTEIPRDYLMKRLGGALSRSHATGSSPEWSQYVKTTYHDPHADAPKMDSA